MTDKGKVVQTVVTTETTTDYDNSLSIDDLYLVIITDVLSLLSIGLSLFIIYYDIPSKAFSLKNGKAEQDCNSNR